MTDLLTHVLVAAVLLAPLAWWTDRLHVRYVPLGMAGATLPDLAKVNYVVPRQRVADLFGVPFSWLTFHRLGGVVAVAVAVALLFERGTRRTVVAVLLAGATSHLFLDSLIERANGLAPPYLYPATWWYPPSGDLYVSSDVWPAAVAVGAVICLFAVRRYAAAGTGG